MPSRCDKGAGEAAPFIHFTCYGRPGVRLDVALAGGDIPGLDGALDEHLFQSMNTKVSYRLEVQCTGSYVYLAHARLIPLSPVDCLQAVQGTEKFQGHQESRDLLSQPQGNSATDSRSGTNFHPGKLHLLQLRV